MGMCKKCYKKEQCSERDQYGRCTQYRRIDEIRKEIEELNNDTDWHRVHGDSTVYRVGKAGLSVHMPDLGESGEADRVEDSPEGSDPYGLGPDYDRDRD